MGPVLTMGPALTMGETAVPSPRDQNLLADFQALDDILELYRSPDQAVQDEAMARAITLCGRMWGGYRAGLDAFAAALEERGSPEDVSRALELREEAEDPGVLIRCRRESGAGAGEDDDRDRKAAVLARYPGMDDPREPTAEEWRLIESCAHLADNGGEGRADPWGALAGWGVPWHPLPEALTAAIGAARPLPVTIAEARAETLAWDRRLEDLAILSGGSRGVVLPTACAARHRVAIDLWRRDLPVKSGEEIRLRLEFWRERGGDDGAGYAILSADLDRLGGTGISGVGGRGTHDAVLRLKAENPAWSLARIAQEVGISRQAVHKHLRRK